MSQPRRGSLRLRLVAACLLVELVAVALLVAGATHLLQRTLAGQARDQASQALALLRHAVAAPLAQRDYATLQQMLDLARGDRRLDYLVLWDHRGKPAAASGRDPRQPLPPRDQGAPDLDRADATLHVAEAIVEAGQVLGRLDLGLSTQSMRAARAEFLSRAIAVGLAALALSTAALAVVALAITRPLARLAEASRRIARGDYAVHVPERSADEIGQLSQAFNTMSDALAERMAALAEGEREQARLLAATRDEQARLTTLLTALGSGILMADADGRVVYANAAFGRLWALREPLVGRSVAELRPQIVAQLEPPDRPLMPCAGAAAQADGSPVDLRTVDGRVVVQRVQPVDDRDAARGCVWIHRDATHERETQARAYQALHDPLTRLLNRRGLIEGLCAAVERAGVEGGGLALLFIDLDDFKQVNDLGGHRAGDDLLVMVGRALGLRGVRGDLVARLGGDEFALLCPGRDAASAGTLAGRLIADVAALRLQVAGHTLQVGCSVGLAMYPDDARDPDDLVACADRAMYRAKRAGKNRWSASGAGDTPGVAARTEPATS